MNKVYPDARAALTDLHDGAVILLGGFGLCGIPFDAIDALLALGRKRLVIVSNNAGTTEHGVSHLLRAGLVEKMVSSYVGENEVFERLMLEGKLTVELVPQGTLAERLRAGGAGIPAFYTPTGVGTLVAAGKEIRDFGGRDYLLETAITGDYAIVRAFQADTEGNLVFRKTARNFNPVMATAARVTIAEAEHIVPAGSLDPDRIHTPAIYVRRVFQAQPRKKPIERLRTR
jgi:3-oxoacid CoA-transferase A subunit